MSEDPSNQPKLTTSQATNEHRASAPEVAEMAIVTISDTRTVETDKSGQYLKEQIKTCGHKLVDYEIVPDDAVRIRSTLTKLLRCTDVIITSGGTGISGRDVTIPVVESMIIKPIPGFGEIFRMLSYQQIKGAAMLSRATGGVGRGALIFAIPGSLNAVQTAWEGILRDELGHLVFEVMRHGQAYEAHVQHGTAAGQQPTTPPTQAISSKESTMTKKDLSTEGLGRHAKK